jgi:ArsR family transcriptional regulator, arsenate/arsenite/antimonite-responsive transcriptional repressor
MKAIAALFKSLADETRLKILWLLTNREELCVCDIMKTLDITQSKASRHLRYLYHLGWVSDRREGLWMYYRLSMAKESYAAQLLQGLVAELAGQAEVQDLGRRLNTWLRAKSREGISGQQRCGCDPAVEVG